MIAMRTVSLKIEEGLDRRLAANARRQGTSKSELVRAALQAYFAEEGLGYSGSCLELAGELIGCGNGPADLSSNSKHMKRFGE
jgi:hypothetical protein